MKDKKLSGKLGDFGSAVKILESVRDKFGWPNSFDVIVKQHELGITLYSVYRKEAIEGLAKRLQDNWMPQDSIVAWVGYLSKQGKGAQRCVYIYCAQDHRDRLVETLTRAGFVLDTRPGQDRDGEGGYYCAIVWEGNDNLNDVNWFTKALEVAGKIQ